ncbi:uncharacterized protein N7484_004461 [Penicillium longicatenatum]|uniref:uncharacterized protein n=1 Tax=Penicillium longicatenatum TaxID=1561947 RepID=UPI002547A5CA|nr:uncharacterized protein N7484_004461 [Penicillium longicatenatum]KAJ5650738.1 hypothetical protein N7484_004461 [Penicillium longicatenatum]
MPSIQNLVLPTILSLAVAANARFNLGDALLGKRLVTNCPNEWTPINYNGNDRCCHGSLSVEEDNNPYCCVMDYDEYRDTDVSFSDCFPFCSGTDYGGPSVSWSNEPTCITRVPFSANGYSSIVSAAVSSGRSYTTTGPATNEATPTSASTSDYNRDNQEATSTWSGDSTMNAAPIATAGSVLGGAAFAAAMLAL